MLDRRTNGGLDRLFDVLIGLTKKSFKGYCENGLRLLRARPLFSANRNASFRLPHAHDSPPPRAARAPLAGPPGDRRPRNPLAWTPSGLLRRLSRRSTPSQLHRRPRARWRMWRMLRFSLTHRGVAGLRAEHATGAPKARQASAQAELADRCSPGEHAGGQWSHRRAGARDSAESEASKYVTFLGTTESSEAPHRPPGHRQKRCSQ